MPVGPVIMIGLSPFPGVKEFVYSNSDSMPIIFLVRKCVQWFGSEVLEYNLILDLIFVSSLSL